LINLAGRVIGIPTLAATDPQLGGGAAPGIGFAIPSSLVTRIAGQIVRHGHVVDSGRAYLGVELATGVGNAAVVAAVKNGGPAARAGIGPGDDITSIGGQKTSEAAQVSTVLPGLKPKQTVTIGIVKPDGSHVTLSATLGQYPGTSV
jgi:putative serine protease PepD